MRALFSFREKYKAYYERKRVRVKPEGNRKVKRICITRIASEPNLATLFLLVLYPTSKGDDEHEQLINQLHSICKEER